MRGVSQGPAEGSAPLDEKVHPSRNGVAFVERVVIRLDGADCIYNFEPTTRREIAKKVSARATRMGEGWDALICASHVLVPVTKASSHHASEDVIKGVRPRPVLLQVGDLEAAIRGTTGFRG